MTDYFSGPSTPRGRSRAIPGGDLPSASIAEGITVFPLIGEGMNISVVRLDPGAVASVHVHDEEQMGYVVAGSIEFHDGEQVTQLRAGDTYHAPAGAPHGAAAGPEGCLILDAFAPARSALIALLGHV